MMNISENIARACNCLIVENILLKNFIYFIIIYILFVHRFYKITFLFMTKLQNCSRVRYDLFEISKLGNTKV
jgi:hypothetical protein